MSTSVAAVLEFISVSGEIQKIFDTQMVTYPHLSIFKGFFDSEQ